MSSIDRLWARPPSPPWMPTNAPQQPTTPSHARATLQKSPPSSLPPEQGSHVKYMEAIDTHSLAYHACLSKDGREVLLACDDGLIRVVDFESRQLVATLRGHADHVLCLAVRDGLLVSGGRDGSLRLWHLGGCDLVMALQAHASRPCAAVCVCPSRRVVMSGGEDGAIKVWSIGSGALLHTLEGHKGGAITSLDGSDLYGCVISTAAADVRVCVWDVETGMLLRTLYGHSMPVTSAFMDGVHVVSGSRDGSVRLWDALTGQLLRRFDPEDGQEVTCVSICGDCIAAASSDSLLRVWNVQTGQLLRLLRPAMAAGPAIYSLCISEGGRMVSANATSVIQLWDMERGQLGRALEGHSGSVASICAHGAYIVSGGRDKTIRIFQAESGCLLRALREGEPITALQLSDGLVAAAGSCRVKLWNIHTGQVWKTISQPPDAAITCVWKSGGLLVTGSCDHIVRVFDVETSSLLFTLEDHSDAISCVCISQGLLVSGSDDGILHVYEAEDGKHLGALHGHTHWVQCAHICSKWIVSGSADKTVRLWEAESGVNVTTLHGHSQAVTSVHMNEERVVVSGGADQTVRVWDGVKGQPIKILEVREAVSSVYISKGRVLAGTSKGSIRVWDDYSNYPSPADFLDMQDKLGKEAQAVAYLFDPTFADRCHMEFVETVTNIHQKFGDKTNWQPLIALLRSKPQVAFAAQATDSLGQAFKWETRRYETLLSLALVKINNPELVGAVLAALAKALRADGITVCRSAQASFLGLPYQHMEDFQLALTMYPLVASEAMGSLWDLVRGPPRIRRRHLGAASYLTRGAGRAYGWVWDEDWGHRDHQAFPEAPPGATSWTTTPKQKMRQLLAGGGHAKVYSSDASTSTHVPKVPSSSSSSSQSNLSASSFAGTAPIVEDWVVPLPDVCGMGPASFLSSCLKLAKAHGNCAIFEKPVVDAVLQFKWYSYYWHFFPLAALSATLAVNFSTYTYFGSDLSFRARLIWTSTLSANALPLFIYEAIQAIMHHREASSYLSNGWNILDVSSYGALAVVLVLRLVQLRSPGTYILAGAVALMLWFKLLYFFRGIRAYSALVRALFKITADIKYYLLILLVFLAGSTNAFYMITQLDLWDYNQDPHAGCADGNSLSCMHDAFGTGWQTFMSLFCAMTSQYNFGLFDGSTVKVLLQLLYMLFIVGHAIILLNILIALMSDSYDNVQQMARGEWRGEQARIILELEVMLVVWYKDSPELLDHYQPRWLHVLREAGKRGGPEDEWGGRVRAIAKEVRKGLEGGVLADTRAAVKALEEEMAITRVAVRSTDKELAEIKASVESMSRAVGGEVAELRAMLKDSLLVWGGGGGGGYYPSEDTQMGIPEDSKALPVARERAPSRRSTTMRRRSQGT